MDAEVSSYFRDHVLFQIFGKDFREKLEEGKLPFKTVSVLHNEELVDVLIFDDGWENCDAAIHMYDSGRTWLTLSWEVQDG